MGVLHISVDGNISAAQGLPADRRNFLSTVHFEDIACARCSVDLTANFANVAAGPLKLEATRLILSFRKGADSSDGRIVVDGASPWGPAHGEANFVLLSNGVRLDAVDVNAGGLDAEGSIALVNGAPSSADLRFDARPGAFLASGSASGVVRLVEGAGDESAIIDVTGRNVRLAGSGYVIRALDLEGRGTLDRLPFTLKPTKENA